MTDTAKCLVCGATVPMEYLPEHIAEHDTSITAQQVRDAPIVREDDPDVDDG